jgi:cytochrome c-type biogenesis protein
LIQELFQSLTKAVEGTPVIALSAAFVWGVLSIVLSPCHLASIPLVIGFIDRQGHVTTRRALLLSTVFATGILVTIAAVGIVTAAAGRLMGDVGRWGNYFVAALFVAVGLHLLDVIPMPFASRGPTSTRRQGLLAALILGLAFGIALGPCTFAFMAPVLGVTFKVGTTSLISGAALLAVYGLGHCSVIVAAGTSTPSVQRYLTWAGSTQATAVFRWACGCLVLLGGVYFIYTAA